MAKASSTEPAGLPTQSSAAERPGGTRLGDDAAPLEHPVFAAWQRLLDQLECEIPVEGQLSISALDATLHALVDDAKGDERDAKRFRALVRETRIEADEEGNIRLVALMPPLPPFELRFRGTQPDGALVRGYVPLVEIEGPMVAAGVIDTLVNTDEVSHGKRPVAVPLLKYAITITKRRKGNGTWSYDVDVRNGSAAGDLRQYLRLLQEAAEQAAPVLTEAGFAVGAADVISIADSLFAVRLNRKEGGGR